jgi:hypothetical protein
MTQPMIVLAEGQQYTYKRYVIEYLECETCKTTFVTHVASGFGKVLTEEDDTELCEGCVEVCKQLELQEESGVKPS